MFTHMMLNRSWLNSASNEDNLWCSDFYKNATLTLFIFCGPGISVFWRAAKQRLKQQIKEKAKVNKILATKRPQQMQWIGTFFLGRKKKNSCWQGADQNHSQRLHCFSWGEMSRVVSQFIPWTNEIFWGLFNFPLIWAKRRRGNHHHWD